MIPPVVMYVLAGLLGVWGAYRVFVGRKPDAKGRGGHLVFGTLYMLMALYLILTTARVIPPPRFFGGPPAAPQPAQPVHVTPLSPIPVRLPPASAPASAPTSAPTSAPAALKAAPAALKAAPAALKAAPAAPKAAPGK